jgi:hypothetical protein
MSDDRRAMLDAINRRLEESQEREELALNLGYPEVLNMAGELRIPQDDGAEIAQRLYYEGYLRGHLGKPYTRADGTKSPFSRLKVVELTPQGRKLLGG